MSTKSNLPDTTKINQPGIYDDVPMAHYLADPCPEPALSASCLNAGLDDSWLHAWDRHPRLGQRPRSDSKRGDVGSAIHTAGLGKGDAVTYCPVLNGPKTTKPGEVVAAWQSKDAKQWLADERAAGRIPLLEHQRDHVESAADRIRAALEEAGCSGGQAEQTVIAEINGVWVKTRPDLLVSHNERLIVDVKSATSAAPKKWHKILWGSGYYTSAALYERALLEVTGEHYEYRWLSIELDRPYAYSWTALDPMGRDIAEARVEKGLHAWAHCLETKEWPAYDTRVHFAEPPAWLTWEHEELLQGDAI